MSRDEMLFVGLGLATGLLAGIQIGAEIAAKAASQAHHEGLMSAGAMVAHINTQEDVRRSQAAYYRKLTDRITGPAMTAEAGEADHAA